MKYYIYLLSSIRDLNNRNAKIGITGCIRSRIAVYGTATTRDVQTKLRYLSVYETDATIMEDIRTIESSVHNNITGCTRYSDCDTNKKTEWFLFDIDPISQFEKFMNQEYSFRKLQPDEVAKVDKCERAMYNADIDKIDTDRRYQEREQIELKEIDIECASHVDEDKDENEDFDAKVEDVDIQYTSK